MISAVPAATPDTVTVEFVFAATALEFVTGLAVATLELLVVFVNLPATVAFSVNVALPPLAIIPLVGVIVNVGVTFPVVKALVVVTCLTVAVLDNVAVIVTA